MSKKKFHINLQHFARNKVHPTLSDACKYNKSMSISSTLAAYLHI